MNKALVVTFWGSVAGVVLCFAMSIYTGVKEQHARKAAEVPAAQIPVPALNQ